VFLYTVDGQQSNPVCWHNDTLSCSTSVFLIISSVSGIVNVMCLVLTGAACLLTLGSLGAIKIAQ
jgi:hypothetical protein